MFELLDVLRFVVEGLGFPESEDDADPFEGQGSDGGIVFASRLSFLAIVGGRPGTPLACVIGEFMERLSQEFGAGVAARDMQGLSAATRDRCDAGLALDFLGRVITVAIGTEGGDQPRDQGVTGAGSCAKDVLIGMLVDDDGDFFVELFNRQGKRCQEPLFMLGLLVPDTFSRPPIDLGRAIQSIFCPRPIGTPIISPLKTRRPSTNPWN